MIGTSDAATELAAIRSTRDQARPIATAEHLQRLARAQALLPELGADALIVGAGHSLTYFTGIGWSMIERIVALVLIPGRAPVILCPAFEAGSLAAALKIPAEALLWQEDEDPYALLGALLAEAGLRRIALDPVLPFGMADAITRATPSATVLSGAALIDACRMRKSPAELALIRQAMAMTLEVQERAARILHPGIRASEVTAFVQAAHRAIGSDGTTFCIVQFGASTAFPHGLPQDDVLAPGDMVLVDTGCLLHGYHSDLTRSYVFGSPDAEQRRIWAIERAAQQAVFDAAGPGVACGALDDAARAVLTRNGLGPDYRLPGLPHRSGHGLGMTIHEAPYLVRGNALPLAPGMCLSNEPMIVLPGRFGIRLEDHFHITETGAEWFTEPSPDIERPFG
ncbi:X-Pro dipeptidase [Haematobacter missouriensis]|uniref:Peptidase M24 family protein n=2 Tax=Haematobacter missouriensis TaxID=366616 RepID=A0A212ANK2_9RHOB|nr:Xaa-Pro peptidase family protein [Haematobacter missouriensis]KFI24800.1 X-Pro dipeptidase [Haematobacter missouriensis]OWJ83013.1 peptidase M24 family protein [Haematobacter missouriensis]